MVKYKSKPEWFKNAYNNIYYFLMYKHPDILNEYREWIKEHHDIQEFLKKESLKK